jgi:hypothetical protein
MTTRANGNVQVELLGSITSGTFSPDPAKQEVTGLEPESTACSTMGVSRLTFHGILIIGI